MTNEERHIAVLDRMLESMYVYDSIQPTTERKKAIKAAIQALEQQPCDDAISRKLAIRAIKNLYPDIPRVDFNGTKRKWADKYAQYIKCERLIEQLPPVTQKSAESEEV